MPPSHEGIAPVNEVIQGVLERLVFASENSDFIVGRLSIRGRKEPVTILGSIPAPRLGEVLELRGKWEIDRKFGEQFRFDSAEAREPSSVKGIEKYLSSGMIEGIGPEMARRIVATFKKETLDIIENSPEKLRSVAGIGPVRATNISQAFREQKAVREVMLFLQTHGISAVYAGKIFKRFGQNSMAVVKMNPYCLASHIKGIGFKSADRIAGDIGFDLKSPLRAQAGLLYVLETSESEGHVYTEKYELLKQAKELLGIEVNTLAGALGDLFSSGQVIIEDDRVYTSAMAHMENAVVRRLMDLLSSPRFLPAIKIDAAVEWIQTRNGVMLSEGQIQAIKSAIEHKVMIITGGPGTGKTTLLKSLLEVLKAKRIRVLLCAPTGRAAKRLSEATNHEAKTIHRLLEYAPGTGFQRNAGKHLDAEIIIVDEASMVDIALMHHLLAAIGSQSGLILVGDADQLPSVGPGNVLGDLIQCGKVKVVQLTQIFRQAQESMIVTNAHCINNGIVPSGNHGAGELSDFYFIEKDNSDECVDIIKELVSRRIPDRFNLNPLWDIQVLSPMHKGSLGTENLNGMLRDILNPQGTMLRGDRFRLGDRVMQVRNNYDKDVYNGDVGCIVSFNKEANEFEVDYQDRIVTYHISEIDELVLAYAVTIHKSQGSEYKAVIIPLSTQHYVLLRRNLIYTAITRGKHLVILVGSHKALEMAVSNRIVADRNTFLANKLM